jgi:hypothetical protein
MWTLGSGAGNDYEFTYDAIDANGILVNRGGGTFTVNGGALTGLTVPSTCPTENSVTKTGHFENN